MKYLKSIIKNNTGNSAKNFALVVGVVIAAMWTLIFLPTFLFIDLLTDYSTDTNLYAVAVLVTSIEAILAILIISKVKSERYEKPFSWSDHSRSPQRFEGYDI